MQEQDHRILDILVITITLIVVLVISSVIILLFIYQKKQFSFLKEKTKLRSEYEGNILRSKLEIQEQTFQNISREIHDNIGQVLTLAKFQLNSLNFENISKAKLQVNSSVDLISEAISDLSDISRSLSSEIINQYGLIKALESEFERIHHLGKIEISLTIVGESWFMDASEELIIFRIIQEALNNIIRHSKANKADVRLQYAKEHLRVCIEDNGVGFEVNSIIREHKHGSGLINMMKRSELIRGNYEFRSEPGMGTVITIVVPRKSKINEEGNQQYKSSPG